MLYSLTFIYRRSTGGYLYQSPKTLTPKFYLIYTVAFLIQTIWIVFFQQNHIAVSRKDGLEMIGIPFRFVVELGHLLDFISVVVIGAVYYQ